jgi:hypothetical protein
MDDKKALRLIQRWRELANAFHKNATEAEDERDRYKVALEEIASGRGPASLAQGIAAEALRSPQDNADAS